MRLNDRNDQELLGDLLRGSHQALAILFDRYGRLILRIASRILQDAAEGEDVMQEVFLEIYRKAPLYEPSKGTVKTWLLQYAYHRSFNRRKYLALRNFYDQYPASALAEGELSGKSGRDGLTAQEWRDVLRRGMQELTPHEREIIRMVAFEGLTVREASEKLQETYVNGRNLYYRGLKKLRQFLIRPLSRREVDDVRS